MNKVFKANFHFIKDNTIDSTEIDLSLNICDQSELVLNKFLDKQAFLEQYINTLKNGNCSFIINPKIPQDIQEMITKKVEEKYSALSCGHILCSSGTTSKNGIPKSFYFPIERAIANANAHSESLDIKENQSILFPLPLSHSFGVVVGIWGSLVTDSNTYTFDKDFSVIDVLDALNAHQIDILYLTPSLARQIIKFAKRYKKEIHCPQKISIGSSILFYEDAIALKKIFPSSDLYYTYGLTEMGPRVSTFKLDNVENMSGLIPIGTPIDGVKMAGECELEVKSNHSALEFEGKFIKTNDGIENTPLGPKILGRKDDTIIYQGINIYPSEIEPILLELEGIDDVVIIGADSKLHGQVPVLVIKGDIEQKEVLKRLGEFLPETHIPKKVYYVEEFPKTALGKIQKKVLKSNLKL